MNVLVEDYRTIQDAATELGTNWFTLHSWMTRHNVPTRKLSNVRLVRMQDLAGYKPRNAVERVVDDGLTEDYR